MGSSEKKEGGVKIALDLIQIIGFLVLIGLIIFALSKILAFRRSREIEDESTYEFESLLPGLAMTHAPWVRFPDGEDQWKKLTKNSNGSYNFEGQGGEGRIGLDLNANFYCGSLSNTIQILVGNSEILCNVQADGTVVPWGDMGVSSDEAAERASLNAIIKGLRRELADYKIRAEMAERHMRERQLADAAHLERMKSKEEKAEGEEEEYSGG